ncbi:MAG: hypothetical protein HFG96_09935 [Lachnospiraceae bacterium]|nr:hypothetical protein [Lachnospiraceae bacterium]
MESTIMDVALSQGIWAVMAIFLLMYVVKGNEKRDLKQEEREKNYQEIIEKLTEKFNVLDEVKNGISDIKGYLFSQTTNGFTKSKDNKEYDKKI